jgi:two-component system cell cycle sensor histidine kinase/response regulator CckA
MAAEAQPGQVEGPRTPPGGLDFRVLVEHSMDMLSVMDAEGVVVFKSASVRRELGYRPEQLVGRSVFDLMHPDDRPAAERAFRDAVAHPGRAHRLEVRCRHRDGSWVMLEALLTSHLDDPRIAGVVSWSRDMSERHRTEQALRRREQQLAEAQAIGHLGSWEYDVATERVTWSDQMYRIFGLEPDRAGPSLDWYLDRLVPEMRGGYRERVKQALSSTRPMVFRHRVLTPAGEERVVKARAEVVRDGSGAPVRLVGTAQDVTDRARAEEALRGTNEMLAGIIAAAPVGIVALDADGKVRLWNPAAERMFGWSSDEVAGKPVPAGLFVDEEAAQGFYRRFERAMRGEAVELGSEGTRRRRDGRPVDVCICTALLRDASGSPSGVVAVMEDLTERNQAQTALLRSQEQLAHAQRMEAVGRLAGGIAHDFNNLLTAIQGNLHFALDSLPPDSPVREDLEEIGSAATRAVALTRQLLAFGRKQVLAPQALDLNESVQSMQRMLVRLMGENVTLRTDLDPSLGPVVADPGQLQQILLNLLLNARDAMPDGGTVTVRTRPSRNGGPPRARLSVVDTGHGIDAETRRHLFEPFFTTKAPGKGTGLGLATVSGIVKQSGGEIWVESEPCRGSSFHIDLPLATGAAAGQAAEAGAAPSEGEQPRSTILLVEDEPAVRALAERILKLEGYRVLSAGGADEALRLVGALQEPLNLLLTDVAMPGASGPELARRLAHAHPGMRVLYMSGYSAGNAASQGLTPPGAALVEKPFSMESLLERVRQVLEESPAAHRG